MKRGVQMRDGLRAASHKGDLNFLLTVFKKMKSTLALTKLDPVWGYISIRRENKGDENIRND